MTSVLLADCIDTLLLRLRAERGGSAASILGYIGEQTGFSSSAIYSWRQGRRRPPARTAEVLAQLGKEAGLSRDWGEQLLRRVGHSNPTRILDQYWSAGTQRLVPNNLPNRPHTAFFGRQHETQRLLQYLSPDHAAPIVTVDGFAGVGKTTLVLEVAYRCFSATTGARPDPSVSKFDSIIFVTAKTQHLTPGGILSSRNVQRTVQEILRTIARTLGRSDTVYEPPEEANEWIRNVLLTDNRTSLLIVDNLESVSGPDRDEIVAFLFDLPRGIKVVITTREPEPTFVAIRLSELEREATLRLIAHEAAEKEVQLSDDQALQIYECIGGLPGAIKYVIGQLADKRSLALVLAHLPNQKLALAQFLFEQALRPLERQPPHYLLLALAMLHGTGTREAIAHIAGFHKQPDAVEHGLAQLQRLSLLGENNGRYSLLPITRAYAREKLNALPRFERSARTRLLNWYVELVHDYAGEDWTGTVDYQRVEAEWDNLVSVFQWCREQGQYDTLRDFWGRSLGGLDSFSVIYGYWDERLVWLTWLRDNALQRSQWSVAIESIANGAYTLVLRGGTRALEVSATDLDWAWNLRDRAEPKVQADLALVLAMLNWRRGRLKEASQFLDERASILGRSELNLGLKGQLSAGINTDFYRGILAFERSDLEEARRQFIQVYTQGLAIGWSRAANYAEHWLADIDIADRRFDEASRRLSAVKLVAEQARDARRMAGYYRSQALLHSTVSDPEASRGWATRALDGFERLGMERETLEMRDLLMALAPADGPPPGTPDHRGG